MHKTVSIIVVSYNTAQLTLEALRSVFRETRSDFEVIVLDNASSDDSVEQLSREFGDRIKLVASQENHGFAMGNNIAACEATGEYLLLLNPDTVVLDAAIDRLLEFAKTTPASGIWGGRTVFADRSLNPLSCASSQSLWSLACQALGLNSLFRNSSLFNPEGLGGWKRDCVRKVDIVSGCFLLTKRSTWEALGGFDSDFFMYGEEADLCLRAKATLGLQPIITPDATVVHYGGASEASQTGKLVKLMAAKTLLIRRHFPRGQVALSVQLLSLWPMTRAWAHRLLTLLGRRASRSRADVWMGVCSQRDSWFQPGQ